MTTIIAYGTVVRPPLVIGFSLPNEERSVGFSVVVEEDFDDGERALCSKAVYRVIISGERARYAQANLKLGSSVLVRGDVFHGYPSVANASWNHRVVFADDLVVLAGELSQSRAYPLSTEISGSQLRVAV